VRLVASGLATPQEVERAALVAFAVAATAGLTLAIAVSPVLIAVGALCMLAGWLYTGGPRPYGYAGLGEVFVFIFFGLVATAGSAYVQLERVTGLAVLAAVPVGLLAVALLVVNNLRDMAGDAAVGKRTLAVRLGAMATRRFYSGCVTIPYVFVAAIAVARPWALMAFISLPLALRPARRVMAGESGRGLVEVLGVTGRLQLVFGVLLAAGIAL
jgi:1,4-dihydroxy-2-naphthoate octaprenyltransferase